MGAIFTDNATLGVVNSTIGAPVFVEADNTDNTDSNSHGQLIVRSGGASGGSAMTLYNNRVGEWSAGISPGDTHFKITSGDDLTQNSYFEISDAGPITFNSAYSFPTDPGNPDQVLFTDGSGQLFWSDVIQAYYSLTPYIVGPDGDVNAQFTGNSGIRDAIAAAVSDGAGTGNYKNIYIKGGAYTLTFGGVDIPAGINLIGIDASGTINANTRPSAMITGIINLVDNAVSDVATHFSNLGFANSGAPNFKSGNPMSTVDLHLIGCYVEGDNPVFYNDQEQATSFNVEIDSCFINSNGSLYQNKGSTANTLNITASYSQIVADGDRSDMASGTLNLNISYCQMTAHFGSSEVPVEFGASIYNSTHSSSTDLINFINDDFSSFVNYTNSVLYNNISYTGNSGGVELDASFQFAGTITAPSYTRRDCLCTTPDASGTLLAFKNNDVFNGSDEFKNSSVVVTGDEIPSVLTSVIVNEGESIVFQGTVIGAQNGNPNGACGGNFMAVAKRIIGSDIELVGVPIVNVMATSTESFSVAVDTGAQAIRVLVGGTPETTYNWITTYTYQKMTE